MNSSRRRCPGPTTASSASTPTSCCCTRSANRSWPGRRPGRDSTRAEARRPGSLGAGEPQPTATGWTSPHRPELTGTLLAFHFINRVVSALLDPDLLPGGLQRAPLVRSVGGRLYARAAREPKEPGRSIALLDPGTTASPGWAGTARSVSPTPRCGTPRHRVGTCWETWRARPSTPQCAGRTVASPSGPRTGPSTWCGTCQAGTASGPDRVAGGVRTECDQPRRRRPLAALPPGRRRPRAAGRVRAITATDHVARALIGAPLGDHHA
ncbi:hypothetical protein NKG94_15120 [Micromonospora sp. M12]